ncbi:MAG: F0F1 ATP synthase subunit B [Gammaproteobacteria bacterium]|nr:F0F1 ATP synthase subunit B [Gammaproteobacteria bacterium]
MNFNLTLIGQTIAMIVFVWFCMKYIWPPLLGAIEQRRNEISDNLAAGEAARKQVIQSKEEAETILAEAREQAVGIVDQAGRRGNGIVEEARAEGAKERERQLVAAKVEMEQSINRAKDELRDRVADLSIATAEKILDREIDAKTHQDLLERLASQVSTLRAV